MIHLSLWLLMIMMMMIRDDYKLRVSSLKYASNYHMIQDLFDSQVIRVVDCIASTLKHCFHYLQHDQTIAGRN